MPNFVRHILYLLGGIGAGDVKFTTAVGALKGVDFVLIGMLLRWLEITLK